MCDRQLGVIGEDRPEVRNRLIEVGFLEIGEANVDAPSCWRVPAPAPSGTGRIAASASRVLTRTNPRLLCASAFLGSSSTARRYDSTAFGKSPLFCCASPYSFQTAAFPGCSFAASLSSRTACPGRERTPVHGYASRFLVGLAGTPAGALWSGQRLFSPNAAQ
jgi:hypothetical protein